MTGSRLSPVMLEVLRSCLQAPDGIVGVAELVARRIEQSATVSVARASLSRTLRRLWRSGLVELGSGSPSYRPAADHWCFRQPRQDAEKYRQMAESARDYARVKRFRKDVGVQAPKGRAEYLARAARPEVRATWVLITDQGRLTAASCTQVNRSQHNMRAGQGGGLVNNSRRGVL